MIISGNKDVGLSGALSKLYPGAVFCSRKTGFDLNTAGGQKQFANLAMDHKQIVICSALWRFNQTLLLDTVCQLAIEKNLTPHIVTIGSTTDRVKNSKVWLYNAEKKALRDYANTLALGGVWDKKPKISHISFGTLSNNSSKHPERKCMSLDLAAMYIKWVLDQPSFVNINELSIDPMQAAIWYES